MTGSTAAASTAVAGGSGPQVVTDFVSLAADCGLSLEVRDALLSAMDPGATPAFLVKILCNVKEAEIEALITSIKLPGAVDQSTSQQGPPTGLSSCRRKQCELCSLKRSGCSPR